MSKVAEQGTRLLGTSSMEAITFPLTVCTHNNIMCGGGRGWETSLLGTSILESHCQLLYACSGRTLPIVVYYIHNNCTCNTNDTRYSLCVFSLMELPYDIYICCEWINLSGKSFVNITIKSLTKETASFIMCCTYVLNFSLRLVFSPPPSLSLSLCSRGLPHFRSVDLA